MKARKNPRYKLMHVYINLKAIDTVGYANLREGIQENLVKLREERRETKR